MKVIAALALTLSLAFAAPSREKRQVNGCPDPFQNVPSPCAADLTQRIYFPHPTDATKFLQCDMFGRMYIIQCPQGEVYQAAISSCRPRAAVTQAPFVPPVTQAPFVPPVVTNAPITARPITNPCTQTAISRGMLYFPVVGDRSRFIECDLAGNPSMLNCATGLLWDQGMLSCVYPLNSGGVVGPVNPTSAATNGAIGNPCTKSAISSNHFFFPNPTDATKFIQCDLWGNKFDVDCPSGLIWNAYLETCFRALPGAGNVGK